MNAEPALARYFETVAAAHLFSSPRSLRFKVEALFDGIDFRGKRVLDVGGGRGVYSFYAAARGARSVVCMEPEGEGSTSGVGADFLRLGKLLGMENVVLDRRTLQEYPDADGEFDVVLMHNSINHLDEDACIRLLDDPAARERYREILSRLQALCAPGAVVVVCDCSRHNAFGRLGLRNPFVPSVDWSKHQTPRTWAELLREAGFTAPEIRWSSFNRLGRWGKALLANPVAAFFLASHFRLVVRKPDVPAHLAPATAS